MSSELKDYGAPIAFFGESGGEFLSELADALAAHLTFTGHGPLSENERTAFVWGFRHGIHQLTGLIAEAAETSPQASATISRIIAEALSEWALGVRVKVYTASGGGDASDVKH